MPLEAGGNTEISTVGGTANITLNGKQMKDYDKMVDAILINSLSGQGVNVKPEYYDQYVMTHEFGHTLLEKGKEAQSKLSSITISRYANSDINEFITKAWTGREIGVNPGKYSQKVGSIIDKYFKFETPKPLENAGKSGIIISDKQLGHKGGKHQKEWGLDFSKPDDRAKFVEITKNIQENAQEVRRVQWLHDPETGRRTVEVNCYILGDDVVLVKDNGEYITTMKDGINNPRVKNGKREE